MTAEQFYSEVGGNYNEVLKRLQKTERIKKYLYAFKEDTCYQNLCKALEEKDYEEAFTCVHNLKGVCANLELTHLFRAADILCEDLRGGNPGDGLEKKMEDVTREYVKTVAKIGEIA